LSLTSAAALPSSVGRRRMLVLFALANVHAFSYLAFSYLAFSYLAFSYLAFSSWLSRIRLLHDQH
jgi:hypothetical protein